MSVMSVMTELKPFPVLHGKYLFYFTPADEGGFSVTCQNVPGVNAEGDTFEEALRDALSATTFVEQCLSDIEAEKKSVRRAPAAERPSRRRREP